MTVTYDLSTNVGKVRRTIGDKIISDPIFTDEEIESFLAENSNSINLASAAALEAEAASYAANADSERIGDYSYTQKIVDKMLESAKRLREKEAGTPAFTWAELNLTGETE